MSASAIAAVRLRHGMERNDSRAPHLTAADEARIHEALFARDSGPLALGATASFEPLAPVSGDERLTELAAQVFSLHNTYAVPSETGANNKISSPLLRACSPSEHRHERRLEAVHAAQGT